MAVVVSVLPRLTTSDDPFGILWPLYCLSFLDLRLLIIPFGILWPLYCLSFLVLRFLITRLVSCGLYIIFPSSISDFWLPLWYLVAIILSVLPRFTTYDYPFGILWPLYCLSFLDLRLLIIPFGILWPLYCLSLLDLRLLITPFVSCGLCIVFPSSIYDFWLPLWYLMAVVLSVLPRFTTSDYPFGTLWPLYFPSFLDLRFLITPLVSCGHCIVCPSSIYDFWLPLWYLVAIVLSVLPRFTTSDYPFGILWPLCCLSFIDLRLMIILLLSCGHCIVFPSSIYDFWLLLWYLVAIVLSVLRFTTFGYPFGILWPLYCLSFLDLRLLITLLVSCGHCIVCPSSIYDFWLPLWYHVAIVLSVLLRFTTFDYPFGILWPLHCLSFLDLRLLIIPFVSCGHCIVFPSSIYDFWLPLWYFVAVVLSVLPRLTTSDYPFGILWPLYFLYFLDLRLLITPLVSCGHCIVCHSSILYCPSFLDLRLLITPLVSCGHFIVCPSSSYDFWLPFWYLVAIALSVLPRSTTSDYPFDFLWPLYCLSFLDLRLMITPLGSCGHCIVCPSSIYDFWFPFWYPVAIVLSVLPPFTISDYPLVSCGLYIVFPSSIYDFWLPLWYLVAIVLSVLPRFTTSDYFFGILWPLYFLSFLDLRFLFTPLVSCGHCIFCPSSIYDFWLLLWYLVAIILSVLPRFTTLITLLVSCGHCIVCPSSIYDFWLSLLYLVAIVLSFPPRFTTSDYPFGILWPLYCLSFLD